MSFSPSPSRILFVNSSTAAHTGDTDRTKLFSYVMKAGTMGPNDILRIWQFNSWTNSANTKTLEIVMGGTNIFTRNVNTTASSIGVRTVANRGALNSQLLYSIGSDIGLGISGTTNTVVSIDTSLDVEFEWFVTLTNAGESVRVEGTVLQLWKAP